MYVIIFVLEEAFSHTPLYSYMHARRPADILRGSRPWLSGDGDSSGSSHGLHLASSIACVGAREHAVQHNI